MTIRRQSFSELRLFPETPVRRHRARTTDDIIAVSDERFQELKRDFQAIKDKKFPSLAKKIETFFARIWAVVTSCFRALCEALFPWLFVNKVKEKEDESPPLPVELSSEPPSDIGLPLKKIGERDFQPSMLWHLQYLSARRDDLKGFLGINADGSVAPVKDALDSKRYYPLLVDSLKATFGERLAQEVVALGKEDKSFLLDQGITLDTIKTVMVAVAANVNRADLAVLFEQIKKYAQSKDRTDLEWGVARILSDADLHRVALAPTFGQLKAYQIKILIDAFRTVFVGDKRAKVLEALYTPDERKKLDAEATGWLTYNSRLLEASDGIETIKLDRHYLPALSQFFAKDVAYNYVYKDMIIPGRKADGSLDYFICTGSHIDNQVLASVWRSMTDPKQCHLVFRGTHPQGHAKAAATSLINNIDHKGIAKGAFLSAEKALQALVEPALIEGGTLTIHGHSQGGVLAQRMTVVVMQEVKKLAAVVLYTHNSPAAEAVCNEDLRKAMARSHTRLTLHYILFEGDRIQNLGDEFVGCNLENVITFLYRFIPKKDVKQPRILHSSKAWVPGAENLFDFSDKVGDFYRSNMMYKALTCAVLPLQTLLYTIGHVSLEIAHFVQSEHLADVRRRRLLAQQAKAV